MGGTLAKLRGASITDLIGLALVALVVLWLAVNFVKAPTEFINIGLIGLTNGTIYGVVALGYTLVYGILQLINFAHGDVFALSGLVASTVIVSVLGLDVELERARDHRRPRDHARRDHGRRSRSSTPRSSESPTGRCGTRRGWRR